MFDLACTRVRSLDVDRRAVHQASGNLEYVVAVDRPRYISAFEARGSLKSYEKTHLRDTLCTASIVRKINEASNVVLYGRTR